MSWFIDLTTLDVVQCTFMKPVAIFQCDVVAKIGVDRSIQSLAAGEARR